MLFIFSQETQLNSRGIYVNKERGSYNNDINIFVYKNVNNIFIRFTFSSTILTAHSIRT